MLIIDVDSIGNSLGVVLCQNIDGSEPGAAIALRGARCLAQSGSGGSNQLVGPKANREEVFRCSHNSQYDGHLYLSRIKSRFYRSGMSNDIQDVQTVCSPKKPLKSKEAPLKPIGTDYPLQRLGMDFAGLRSTAENQFTLLAQTVTKTLMERYVAYFGAPDQLHIDQGQSVEAELMLELGRLIQIQSTAYNL
ncbi:hypothetical protein T12_14844 [Trichinella patagoniensis]|uniref:Uncharacterized protein n=1 Tax=Trichinella patagoniensis TaxID=990121 RepID=A0A0V1A962_9BILA|nr:hypothetical protein T12_14844 [Trichinella patagoniensis]